MNQGISPYALTREDAARFFRQGQREFGQNFIEIQ